MELSPPIIAARLKDTHRLIPSRYPPTGILDLITSPQDFEAVAELDHLVRGGIQSGGFDVK